MLHPGVTIFSALLAVCRKDKVKPHDFFRAAAAGYEATIRLACMVQPEHKKKGFHASATCGTIGAAVAVSVSRNYSRIELKNAISAATTSASGLLEMIDDDSELKPYNCAQAAVNGIMAANMAKVGYKGPKDAIGGKRGFICAFNGTINLQKIESALVMENCVNSIYRKLYASCRHTHSAVEAALMLRTEYDIALNDIKEIIVATYDLAVYGHDNTEVHSISAAKMSTPYSVATALIYGKSGLDAFTEKMLADSLVRALTQKVKVISKSAFTCLVPKIRAAEVTIELINGDKYKSRVNYPKGEPENPLSNEEMEKKFTELLTAANMEGEYITKLQNSIVELHNNWNTYFELITC